MFQLAWILVFVLEFTAGAGGIMERYAEPGRDVILPCGSASSLDKCGSVTWLYNKDNSNTLAFVLSGIIVNKNRIARRSLGHDCSLVIKNITAEDIGVFTCRNGNVDSSIYLNLLTISLTPPDADPKRDGKVTLQCSLTVYAESGLCQHHSVRWVDETGTVLLGEGVGYRLERQTNCLSVLTVWPHGGRGRKYTCQVVDGQNRVKAESSYTPVFRGDRRSNQPERSNSGAGGIMERYAEPGRDVILPCGSASSSDKCGSVTWLYNKDYSNTLAFVLSGIIVNSGRIPRPSLGHDCSLVIKSITAEDVGLFTCRIGNVDSSIHLNLLTISLTPPDADPKRDGKVTLQCSLTVSSESGLCQHHSVRWVDETGTVLLGEGVGYRLERQTNCLSVVTVWPHGGRDRKYTCQVVDGQNRVKAESSYTPVFRGDRRTNQPERSNSDATYIILTLRIVGMILMVAITILVIKDNGNTKLENDDDVNYDDVEVYENVEVQRAAPH